VGVQRSKLGGGAIMSIPNEVLFAKIKKLQREFDILTGRYTPKSWRDVQDIVTYWNGA